MIQKLSPPKHVDSRPIPVGRCTLQECVMRARWVDSLEELVMMKGNWRQLSDNAVRANLAFDHYFLIPAFKHLNDRGTRVLVIEADSPDLRTPLLCGLVPLVRRSEFPIPSIEVWKHEQCTDSTPLIRRGWCDQVLRTMFDFLESESFGLFGLETMTAEGPIQTALSKVLAERGSVPFQRHEFSRGAFRPADNADLYVKTNLSKNLRKRLRRSERQLSELGEWRIESSNSDTNFSEAANQFLNLEKSGWKGRDGTALASHDSSTQFFQEFVDRASSEGKITFIRLLLNEKPIAILVDLYSGDDGFAYKTAFAEVHSRLSPGLFLESKNIEFMHGRNVTNVDSGTDPANQTINRIWADQMKFQSLVIPLRRGMPSWATAVMPMAQRLLRVVRNFRQRSK